MSEREALISRDQTRANFTHFKNVTFYTEKKKKKPTEKFTKMKVDPHPPVLLMVPVLLKFEGMTDIFSTV